jgi:hypothetical protein
MMRPIIPVLLSATCLWPCLAGAADRPPQYVGRAQCAPCHAEQAARWKGSQHDLAMQEATESSMLSLHPQSLRRIGARRKTPWWDVTPLRDANTAGVRVTIIPNLKPPSPEAAAAAFRIVP